MPSNKWTKSADFETVAVRYLDERAPSRYTTNLSYRNKIRNTLIPKWGAVKLADIRPLAIDRWFSELDAAPTTKAGIRTVFRQILEFAMLLEALPIGRNPVDLVRIKGSTRRSKKIQVLTPEDCARLIEEITAEPARTMAIVALCLGIRRSELTGLQWGDFDWSAQTVLITRSVVDNRIGEVKTEASGAALPLDTSLVDLLQKFRNTSRYKGLTDWAFASEQQNGRSPVYPNSVQKIYLRPAGVRAGLGDHVGWHTLRHAYRTLLATAGTSLTVQKDLLRHSNISMTSRYGGSIPADQRAAQSAVARMIIG